MRKLPAGRAAGVHVHILVVPHLVRGCPNAGGFDQHIYGNAVSIP